jgi:CheY-like chemotaxis protein
VYDQQQEDHSHTHEDEHHIACMEMTSLRVAKAATRLRQGIALGVQFSNACEMHTVNDPEHLRPANPDQTVLLIAEDEVIIRNIARIVLEGEGYFILAAGDGAEALEISRKFPGPIHALLSDVRMPNKDGLQLREEILIERPGIKVLLMSGHVDAPVGDIPFLPKPFTPTVLKEQIRHLLEPTANA